MGDFSSSERILGLLRRDQTSSETGIVRGDVGGVNCWFGFSQVTKELVRSSWGGGGERKRMTTDGYYTKTPFYQKQGYFETRVICVAVLGLDIALNSIRPSLRSKINSVYDTETIKRNGKST